MAYVHIGFKIFLELRQCFFILTVQNISNQNSNFIIDLNFSALSLMKSISCCCSDFRYESNGIFVLGVGFFSSDKFRLFN